MHPATREPADNKTFWQNTADAPLPRREYSVRNDYNLLRRTNRIVLNNDGWLHEQDNQKIIRDGDKEKLLVEEKGVNSYKRADDSKCEAARVFWEKNKSYWIKVRTAWEDYLATHATVELRSKVDGQVLHECFNDLAKEYATGKIKPAGIDAKIKSSLEKFLGHDKEGMGTK